MLSVPPSMHINTNPFLKTLAFRSATFSILPPLGIALSYRPYIKTENIEKKSVNSYVYEKINKAQQISVCYAKTDLKVNNLTARSLLTGRRGAA